MPDHRRHRGLGPPAPPPPLNVLEGPLPVRSGPRSGAGADALKMPRSCPLCGSGAPPQVWSHTRCAGCDGPLALPMDPEAHGQGLLGRRGALRCERDHLARLHVGWPSESVPVRWRDLSLTGLSVVTEAPVALGRCVRVIDAGFDGLAEVIRCERHGRLFHLHAKLLRANFVQASGVFVHVKA